MTTARRSSLPEQTGNQIGNHAGLILARYLEESAKKGSEQAKNAKQALFKAAKQAVTYREDKSLKRVYDLARERWRQSLPHEWRLLTFDTVSSRIIIGLGGENVTETGLTLHHTYGVPYLPGAALKGVASRYARQVWGANDPSWHPAKALDQPNHFRTIFGTTGEGGLVDFLDGWMLSKDILLDDVMTPHHGDYYMADDKDVREPTDFDRPIPVPFLAVRGAFQVAICKRDDRLPNEWLDLAAELLIQALAEFGIGGKTNAGYGRLTCDRERTRSSTPAAPAPEPARGDELEMRIEEGAADGQLTVATSDASQMGLIANKEQIPAELRAEGRRLICRPVHGGEPDQPRFEFVRAAPD